MIRGVGRDKSSTCSYRGKSSLTPILVNMKRFVCFFQILDTIFFCVEVIYFRSKGWRKKKRGRPSFDLIGCWDFPI